MRKYLFKFNVDGKPKRKTIQAETIPDGLKILFEKTTGDLKDIDVICKGEIKDVKPKKK
jgi:hypothetical protein